MGRQIEDRRRRDTRRDQRQRVRVMRARRAVGVAASGARGSVEESRSAP
jgi:hypothetical protein